MAKFLDDTGLSHLWDKIKSKFYTKTETDTLLGNKADTSDIPIVNNATLTIQKNGSTVTTFTANASSNATANITVPTKISELTNDKFICYNTNDRFHLYFNTITGCITNGGKDLYLFIPMPFCQKVPATYSLNVGLVLRHADGGYAYYRDGSESGSFSYYRIGDSYEYVWVSGQSARYNAVTGITFNNLSYGGFTMKISFGYPLAKDSTGTALTNNTPIAAMVDIDGFIS